MRIFIYGDDGFRVREKANQMRQAFIQRHDPTKINVTVLPARESERLEPNAVRVALRQSPFLAPKRMVIVTGILTSATKKADYKIWEEIFSSIPTSTILVCLDCKSVPDIEKHPLITFVSSLPEVHKYPFPSLVGASLVSWVIERANSLKGRIDRVQAQELVSRVGSDLFRMDAELRKLVSYAGSGSITKEAIEELVRPMAESNLFGLMDTISGGDGQRAAQLLMKERQAGSDAFSLWGLWLRQIRLLRAASQWEQEHGPSSAGGFGSVFRLHQFVAKKTMSQQRAFSPDALVRACARALEADQLIKRRALSAEAALELMIADLLKTKHPE
ncbi:DNA polymerase III subunit delta [Candidatus Uhrbacteria bacterium]|nr:DNA polymerase III subunit delta [Candidatus Uhrbacteria bacterium]